MAKRILLVEDEKKLVANLAEKLRADGYEVAAALDGEAGWEHARDNDYDLIILDIMLPGLDGVSLCRMIRNSSRGANVPIIMLTARGTEQDKILGLETGADDYIVKPFGLGEFLSRVRVQMRRPVPDPNVKQDELRSGDLQLDLTGRRAYKGGAEVKLSNKEFALLTVFMRNRGAVLSRHLLITNVWGEDFLIGENDRRSERTVDVHIRWLREKLEDNPSRPERISTVRGVGYRFEG